MSRTFHSSRPDAWVQPRQAMSASERLYRHGPIQSMPDTRPGLLARLLTIIAKQGEGK